MTMTDVALPSGNGVAKRADFVGQATAVEQARAVAEVQAAVIVAQQVPRSIQDALSSMRESCQQPGLADRAFYKFPRAGGSVSGASVHLARELARCWGNVQYGIQELRRDDEGKYSEMQAWAWDVQTNTRSSTVFVVPHKRDVKGGPVALVDLRDVYENNANQGSRRLRETIFSILPTWFTEEAKALCTKTLADGGEKTTAQRVADAIRAFEGIGIKVDRLERKIGAPADQWTPLDVAGLRVSFASLQQGTVTAAEEFPQMVVTADDIPNVNPTSPTVAPETSPAPAPEPPPPADSHAEHGESTPSVAADTTAAILDPPAERPTTAKGRQPRVPTNKDGDPAGSEYGDVKAAGDAQIAAQEAQREERTRKATQSTEGVLSPEQMITQLAAQHGVENADDNVRAANQILGKEFASLKDLDGAQTARVLRHYREMPEDEPFVFAGEGVPVPVLEPDAKAVDVAASVTPPPPQQPDGDPESWTGDQWRRLAADVGVGPLMFGKQVKAEGVNGFDAIAGSGKGTVLLAWLKATAEEASS